MAKQNISDICPKKSCIQCTRRFRPSSGPGRPRKTCGAECAKRRDYLMRRNQGERSDLSMSTARKSEKLSPASATSTPRPCSKSDQLKEAESELRDFLHSTRKKIDEAQIDAELKRYITHTLNEAHRYQSHVQFHFDDANRSK